MLYKQNQNKTDEKNFIILLVNIYQMCKLLSKAV